jgi:hypothetical protein
MLIIVIVIGVALIVFGAFILVRYADRPGGTLKWLGLEVSSTGAGLPLIALGIGSVLVATISQPNDPERGGDVEPPSSESTSSSSPSTSPYGSPSAGGPVANAFADSSSCLNSLFSSLPGDRVAWLEAGVRDLDVIAPPQPLTEPFGLVFTQNGQRIGALRMRLYPGDLLKIESIVDTDCLPIAGLQIVGRGGNPLELMNYDTVRMRFGESEYDLRIGAGTTIRLNFVQFS